MRLTSSLRIPVPSPMAKRARLSRRIDSVGSPWDHDTRSVISLREYGCISSEALSDTGFGGKSLWPTTAAPTPQSWPR